MADYSQANRGAATSVIVLRNNLRFLEYTPPVKPCDAQVGAAPSPHNARCKGEVTSRLFVSGFMRGRV